MATQKILFVNAGLENGGGLTHIVLLLQKFQALGQPADLLVFSEGPVAQAARQAGIHVIVLPTKGRLDLTLTKRLLAAIIAGHYTIVHSHGPRANLYLARIRRRLQQHQILWTITVHSDPRLDFINRGLAGRIFTKINLKTLHQAQGVFAVSTAFNRVLVDELQLPAARVRTIYNGLDFRPTSAFTKVKHTGFNLINVARLTPVKNQALLIAAFKAAALPNAHLYIIGDGELKPTLQQQINEAHLQDQITLGGFYDHEQLDRTYAKMDLAVLSSKSESFPLVILEAAEQSVPVVATAVGDVAKMIENGVTGWIATPDSVADFAKQLQLAANSEATGQLAAMGQRFRAEASANFSLDRQARQVLSGYQTFLEQQSKSSLSN